MSYFNDLFVEIWENLAEDDEFLALSQEQQQETVFNFYTEYLVDLADQELNEDMK